MKAVVFIVVFMLGAITLIAQCNVQVDAGMDFNVCPGDAVFLDGSVSGDYLGYSWSPENRVLEPNELFTEAVGPGTYTLTGTARSGDNVIINGDFAQGNSGFTTDYLYSPVGCWGCYFVGNNPNQLNGGFLNCDDVTGEGQMMIFDASDNAGLDSWCQQVAVTPNSDHIFIFHATSVIAAAQLPVLSVKFNGNPERTFNVAGGPCNWQEFTTIWNSGAAVNAEICIENINTNTDFGNDWALDNIQLYGTCEVIDEVIVGEVLMPLDAQEVHTIPCENYLLEIPLTDYPSDPTNYTITWTTFDGNIVSTLPDAPYTATVNAPGVYEVELLFDDGSTVCVETIEIEVESGNTELLAFPEETGELQCANSISRIDAFDINDDYEYRWYADPGNIIGRTDTTFIEVNQEGTYFLIETDPASGCVDTTLVDVFIQENPPQANIQAPVNINCSNINDVQLDGSNSVVNADDQFEWTTLNGNFTSDTDSIIVAINAEGEYQLIVSDSISGCSDTAIVSIAADLNKPSVQLPEDSLLDCSNNAFWVSNLGTNNNSDLNYQWSGPGISNNQDSLLIDQPGIFILTLTDSSSLCSTMDTIIVSDSTSFPAIDFEEIQDINCNNSSVELTLENTDNLQIQWTTSDGQIIGQADTSHILAGQTGWYIAELFNPENGCRSIDSILVEEDYDLPALSTQDSSVFTCTDSIVQLTANTDFTFPNLVFGWYTPDGNILSDPDQGQIQVSSAGNYFFTIFNPDNGCADTVQQVVVPDQDLPVLSVDASSLELNCLVSQITLTADASSSTGGPVAYQWSTGEVGVSIDITEPGTYAIEVLDPTNNCVNSSSVTVTIDTVAPSLSLQPDALIDCQQTSVSLAPLEGESTDLLYSWSTSDGVIIGDRNQYQIQTDAPGNYLLQVTNPDNGCLSIDSISVEQDAEIPNAFVAEPDVIDCQNTSVALNATQSDTGADFDLQWSTPDGNFSDLSNPTAPIVDQPGSYTLVVRNVSNNCVDSTTVIVQSNADLPIIQFNTPDSLGCNTPQTTVNANISNATATSIQWSTPDGSILNGQLTPSILVNTSGTYVIQVENLDNGCITVDSVQVSGVATGPTSFDLFYRNPDCLTQSAAFALSNVQGGQMPYTVLLNSQVVPLNDTINIAPGNYIAQVVDANGCVLADTFQVNELPIYSANIGPDITITAGDNELLIPQFSFDTSLIEQINWFPNDAVSCESCVVTEFIAPQTTELELVVNTEDGCSARANILITVLPARDVFIPSAFSPNADNINDFFTVFVSDERVRSIERLQVFDRWGNQVFDNKDFPPNEQVLGWDGTFNGKELDPAVFIYAAEVEFIDGTVRLFSGDVTLVK